MSIDIGHVAGNLEKRVERIKKAMREEGFDLLILTRDPKIMYVSGSYEDICNFGAAVLVPLDSDPIYIAISQSGNRLPYECWIKDIRLWHPPYWKLEPISFIDKVLEVLKEKKMEKATIGVETDYLPYPWFKTLMEKMPNATFKNGEDLIERVMIIKDDEEIALTRQVCAIADVGIEAFIREFRVGMKECEVAGIVEKAMRDAGAYYFYGPTQVNSCNEVEADHLPTEKIIQRGTVLKLDLGPSYKGYRSDIFRSFSVGKPSQEVKKIAEVMKDGAQEMLEACVPGAKVADIAKRFHERVEKAGYSHYPPRDLGHGIGTGLLPPLVISSSPWKLQENMVVVLNPHVTIPGVQTVMLEFQVLVTQKNPELLHKCTPLELVVLDV
jgi:Xaa-Pro aminopeptidase